MKKIIYLAVLLALLPICFGEQTEIIYPSGALNGVELINKITTVGYAINLDTVSNIEGLVMAKKNYRYNQMYVFDLSNVLDKEITAKYLYWDGYKKVDVYVWNNVGNVWERLEEIEGLNSIIYLSFALDYLKDNKLYIRLFPRSSISSFGTYRIAVHIQYKGNEPTECPIYNCTNETVYIYQCEETSNNFSIHYPVKAYKGTNIGDRSTRYITDIVGDEVSIISVNLPNVMVTAGRKDTTYFYDQLFIFNFTDIGRPIEKVTIKWDGVVNQNTYFRVWYGVDFTDVKVANTAEELKTTEMPFDEVYLYYGKLYLWIWSGDSFGTNEIYLEIQHGNETPPEVPEEPQPEPEPETQPEPEQPKPIIYSDGVKTLEPIKMYHNSWCDKGLLDLGTEVNPRFPSTWDNDETYVFDLTGLGKNIEWAYLFWNGTRANLWIHHIWTDIDKILCYDDYIFSYVYGANLPKFEHLKSNIGSIKFKESKTYIDSNNYMYIRANQFLPTSNTYEVLLTINTSGEVRGSEGVLEEPESECLVCNCINETIYINQTNTQFCNRQITEEGVEFIFKEDCELEEKTSVTISKQDIIQLFKESFCSWFGIFC